MTRALRVAVAGNPNVGKTSLFNELTGSRYQVGNYPGVTVERRVGTVSTRFEPSRPVELVDLPGTYSLTAFSDDEAVAFRALAGMGEPAPDVVLLVLDASNLARNLYLALQIRELGRPLVVALNMTDVAEQAGVPVDAAGLSSDLGVPVVETVARTGQGARAVVDAILEAARGSVEPRVVAVEDADLNDLASRVGPARARWLVTSAAADKLEYVHPTDEERSALAALDASTLGSLARRLIQARYTEIDELLGHVGQPRSRTRHAPTMARSRQIDRVVTHPVWGLAIFVFVMAMVFNSIFQWAEPVMDLAETAMGATAVLVRDLLGPGLLTDLLCEGVIAGAGNVIVFVPQIALLFLFLGLLEDSGYLARAAFLMDRIMSRVGLHGRAFVPLMSGYACAIPAILGTRTISSFRDRLVAILMIPFMSCSARLPVYLLVVYSLFDADRRVLGPFSEGSLIVLGMYLLSTVSALLMGWLYKRTLVRSPTPPLILELPPYRMPRLRNTLLVVYDRSMDFVRNAGTIILAFTVVLWALLSFPRVEETTARPGAELSPIAQSYGGRAARALEPLWEPMGQDWRMGIGIIGSFAAREVLVSTLGLVYGVEASDDDQVSLRQAIREDRDPDTGKPRYTRLSGLALMVFFVYACQCVSTLAVVRRETRSWRWPVFMFLSMTTLAFVAATLVYQVGRALGL